MILLPAPHKSDTSQTAPSRDRPVSRVWDRATETEPEIQANLRIKRSTWTEGRRSFRTMGWCSTHPGHPFPFFIRHFPFFESLFCVPVSLRTQWNATAAPEFDFPSRWPIINYCPRQFTFQPPAHTMLLLYTPAQPGKRAVTADGPTRWHWQLMILWAQNKAQALANTVRARMCVCYRSWLIKSHITPASLPALGCWPALGSFHLTGDYLDPVGLAARLNWTRERAKGINWTVCGVP